MDRERGAREDDDLEGIEAELDGQPTVEPYAAEPGGEPAAAGPSPAGGPLGNGPPEHWLAYIRARAPGLLEPGGPLAGATTGRGPDVIPHGNAAPAPRVEPAGEVARSASAGVAHDPFSDAVVVPAATASATATTPVEPDVPPVTRSADATGDDSAAPGSFTNAEQRGTGTSGREPHPTANDDRIGVISGHVDPVDRARDASRPTAWPDGEPAGPMEGTPPAAPIEPAPRPTVKPGDDPWPALDRRDESERPLDDPFPPPVPRAPSLLWPAPADDAYPARPAAPRSSDGWPAAWPALPDPPGQSTPPRARPGEWRIQAARRDGHVPADLPLPAWPTLPDEPPDDEPDWSLADRRLERATRLDLEQRRR